MQSRIRKAILFFAALTFVTGIPLAQKVRALTTSPLAAVSVQCPPNCGSKQPAKTPSTQRNNGASQEQQAKAADEYRRLAREYAVAVQRASELQENFTQNRKQLGTTLLDAIKSSLENLIDTGVDVLREKPSGRTTKSQTKSRADLATKIEGFKDFYDRVKTYTGLLDDITKTADDLIGLRGDNTELALKIGKLDAKLQTMKIDDRTNPNQKHSSDEYRQLTREYLETVKQASLLNAKVNSKQGEFWQRMKEQTADLTNKTIDESIDLYTKGAGKTSKGKAGLDPVKIFKDAKDRFIEYKKLTEGAIEQVNNYQDSKNDLAELELKLQKLDAGLQKLKMGEAKGIADRPMSKPKTETVLSATDSAAKERNELLVLKSLVDKGSVNRDSLSPQMRKQLESFEANQAIIGNEVKGKSPKEVRMVANKEGLIIIDPDTGVIERNQTPVTKRDYDLNSKNTTVLRDWLASHPAFLKRVLKGNLPPESGKTPIEITDMEASDPSQVPRGWIICQCPPEHIGLGFFVKGVQYHSSAFHCPN